MLEKINFRENNVYILGISTHHTATATLIKNGTVVASVSEERFNGIKSFNGFPKSAIDWCLGMEGITGKDLTYITMPYRQRPNYFPSSKITSESSSFIHVVIVQLGISVREVFRAVRFLVPQLQALSRFMYRLFASTLGEYYTKKQVKIIADYLQVDSEKIIPFDHHLSHAAAAYYASPYNAEKALVFTLDAEGDSASGSVSVFNAKAIKILARIPREYSLGYIYGSVTKFLGMKPHEHEYKVMGLAPYAKNEDVQKVYKKIQHSIELNPKNKLLFTMPIHAQDYTRFLTKTLSGTRFDHMSGAVQLLLEERVVEWIQTAVRRTGISTVILSGGVFMNVKANMKIAKLKEIKKFYVLPSCADESAPLGSCYLGMRKFANDSNASLFIPPITTLYWGPSFGKDEIERIIKEKKYKKYHVTQSSKIEEEIAKLLARGEIVAHVHGRMEFGARALGNRSILADPRHGEIIKVINEKVKNRDFWMPFAPSILHHRQKDYLVNPRNLDASFMMLAFDTTEKGKRDLVAAKHPYDDTVRPQLVTEKMNPRFYRILTEFEKKTGVGALLNTSFNLHGYPIVLGPVEALEAFMKSDLTNLVIENYLIQKKV